MFTYIIPVKCKPPEKFSGLFIVKIPKTNIIIPLWPSCYMPQNPQNAISQTDFKYYNQFRRVKT